MAPIVPNEKPRLSSTALAELTEPFHIDRSVNPLLIVGIRGYYLTTMGDPTKDDRGIYDDAIFVDTPNGTCSFNGNTNPSSVKVGEGYSEKKGMAELKLGLWFSYKLGIHKTYSALVQTGGKVVVLRDGSPNYEDGGYFGINIHKGGYRSTSSKGCQTIYPEQWNSFISLVTSEAKRLFHNQYKERVIPYLLIENKGTI